MKVISEMASGAVGLQVGLAKGELKEEIMGKVQPISVKAHITGNTWLNYSIYLNSVIIPGVLQLLILQMTVYAIGVEIKKRTSREWLAKAGGSIHVALLGKLLVHTAIYMAVGLCSWVLYTALWLSAQLRLGADDSGHVAAYTCS